jgi:hypothetical protein
VISNIFRHNIYYTSQYLVTKESCLSKYLLEVTMLFLKYSHLSAASNMNARASANAVRSSGETNPHHIHPAIRQPKEVRNSILAASISPSSTCLWVWGRERERKEKTACHKSRVGMFGGLSVRVGVEQPNCTRAPQPYNLNTLEALNFKHGIGVISYPDPSHFRSAWCIASPAWSRDTFVCGY